MRVSLRRKLLLVVALTALSLCGLFPARAGAAQYIDATDPRIVLLGTWRPWNETFFSLYPGSAVRVKVEGTAWIDLGDYASGPPRLRVRRLGQNGGTIYNVNNTIRLDAPDGPVEFEAVFIATDGVTENGTSFWLKGLWLADGSTLGQASAPDGRLRVEFLGDSITHGVRILRDYGSNLYSQDASQCYGYYLARALHAPYRVRGHSGISTADLDNKVGVFSSGVPLPPTPDPDYVFLNTGANDVSRGSSWFREELGNVLTATRNRFPTSYIYVLDFFNQQPDRRADIQAAISDRAAGHAAYFNASQYIRAMPDGIHPTGASHAALASALAGLVGPAPTVLSPLAGKIVSKRPELVWAAMPEADSYYLWLSREGAKYATFDNGSATNWLSGEDQPSGEYTWWVQARNRYANLRYSNAGSYRILPYLPDAAPAGLAPAGAAIDPVRRPVFSWAPVERATFYYLWIQRNGQVYRREWVEDGTAWQVDEDLPGGTYRWWVRGWNADGDGPWSDTAAFTLTVKAPDRIVPASPAGYHDEGDAQYTWQADAAATWYQLWVSRNGSVWHEGWEYVGVTNGAVTRAVPDHTLGRYRWWVRGWGPDGMGPWSDPLEFSYGQADPLAPTGIVTNTRMPGFAWRQAGDVPWYRLWISRDGDVYADRWLTGTNWTFTAELPYGSYQWWVNTWKDGVRGPWAGPAEFAIGAAVPEQPAGLQPGPPTELRWSDAGCSDAAWYEVRIDWGTRTFWQAWIRRDQTVALPGAMRAFDDLPAFIPPFGAYTWQIRAWHATGGMGPWSEGLGFTVP